MEFHAKQLCLRYGCHRIAFYSVEQVLTHAEFALLDESLGALVTHIGTVSVASGTCLVAV